MNNYQLSVKSYPLYKDSDYEWDSKIPTAWQETRVKNIFKLVTDLAPEDNNFELLSLFASIGVKPRKDMEQRGNKSVTTDGYWIVKKGDIIVNKLLAWMGAIGLSNYDGVTSPAYDILRKSSEKVDQRFYTYLFRTEIAQAIFKKQSRGIMDVRLRLYFDKFGAISVPFPPPEEQKLIATYLDTKNAQCERKIDLLTQKATQYGKLKQSLINKTVTRGLDKSVLMKDSAIGEIPEHWQVKRLKDLSDIQNSNVDKKSYDDEIPVKLCNYVDVYKNEFVDSSLNFMEATATKSEIKQFTIKKGDVFITKDSETCDDIAIPALATESLDNVLCGYHLARFRMKEKIFLGSYLFRLFQSKSYGFRFVISAKGITRVGLGQSAIADSLTPVPPLSEQKAIADYLDKKTAQIDQIIQTLNTQIEKLKELRKTLINDVVTGKIKVIE